MKSCKKSKDDRCAIYLDFAIRAIQMIGAALTIVGAFAMIHSRINYGTHEFWSTERKAKVAAKKLF